MMPLALVLALLAAAPSPPPAPPRAGQISNLIHSDSFKRPVEDRTETFRVDYSVGVNWSLAERKSCFFNQCHHVCDMTLSHKLLSRQLWWLPETGAPILAQNSPAQREYAGGVSTFNRPCASVADKDATRVAKERLRPYQFADEMIRDRPQLQSDADAYLHVTLPAPPNPKRP
jgi:hypothetical protein